MIGIEELSSAMLHVTSEPHFPYIDTEGLTPYGLPWCFQTQESACSAGDLGSVSGWEDPLEEEMGTLSRILA